MKIKLEIELDVGNALDGKSDEEIAQILFDSYVNYTTVQHFGDTLQYCSLGKIGSDNPDMTYAQLYHYHQNWGEICSAAKWNFVKSE